MCIDVSYSKRQRVCVCVCVYVIVYVCACACVCACVFVCDWYDCMLAETLSLYKRWNTNICKNV